MRRYCVMKIEIVENQKIKVTLTVNDLLYYNLKPETLSPNSPELHKFLFYIMENVRKETGFNPYSGQVVIEAVQSSAGITLYISRMKNEAHRRPVPKKINPEKVRVSSARRVPAKNRYSFDEFSNVCGALRYMGNGALGVSSLYKYNNKWYFILGACKTFEESHCVLCEHCTDFGGMIYSETFLQEHGEMIAKEASLVSMAEGIRKLYSGEN